MNTLQNKINDLPTKSFQVLTAAIEAMSYNESDCEFEDIKVDGLNDHAIAGCLARLTDFFFSEDLEESGSGYGHLICLGYSYGFCEIQNAINVRLSETAEADDQQSIDVNDVEVISYTREMKAVKHGEKVLFAFDRNPMTNGHYGVHMFHGFKGFTVDHDECNYKVQETIIKRALDVINSANKLTELETKTAEAAEIKVKPKVKRLKDSTIKRYTNDQLINHLDRLQSELDEPLYRITCNQVFAYNQNMKAYCFECTNYHRESILDCIRRSWYALDI